MDNIDILLICLHGLELSGRVALYGVPNIATDGVCLSVCVSVCVTRRCSGCKTAERIEIRFWVSTLGDPIKAGFLRKCCMEQVTTSTVLSLSDAWNVATDRSAWSALRPVDGQT